MTVIRQNRRQFLQGVGGFTLALPFLPSLVEKAHAQAAFTPAPRMVMMATQHGAAYQENMFPAADHAVQRLLGSDRQARPAVPQGQRAARPAFPRAHRTERSFYRTKSPPR